MYHTEMKVNNKKGNGTKNNIVLKSEKRWKTKIKRHKKETFLFLTVKHWIVFSFRNQR